MKLTNFNGGAIIIKIAQNSEMIEFKVSNFKKLTLNQLAGTVANQLFTILKRYRACGIKTLSSKEPVSIRIENSEGKIIASSATLQTAYQSKLRLTSQKSFGLALFTGLLAVNEKVSLHTLQEIASIGENEQLSQLVNSQDQLLWVKPAKVKEVAE